MKGIKIKTRENTKEKQDKKKKKKQWKNTEKKGRESYRKRDNPDMNWD